MALLEYYDGINWLNNGISNYITQISSQSFNFTNSQSNFNLFFPNSGGNGVKLRMGRETVSTTGLFGFEFHSTCSGSGTPMFYFRQSGTNAVYDIFSVKLVFLSTFIPIP